MILVLRSNIIIVSATPTYREHEMKENLFWQTAVTLNKGTMFAEEIGDAALDMLREAVVA